MLASAAILALSPGRWWASGCRTGTVAGAGAVFSLVAAYLLAAAVGQSSSDQWLNVGGGFVLPYSNPGTYPHGGGLQAPVLIIVAVAVLLGLTAALVRAAITARLDRYAAQQDTGEPDTGEPDTGEPDPDLDPASELVLDSFAAGR